ncbi:N-acetylmuramoyl-L-alanine amidase [Saccharopolyspora gregorii]|uniref:N-acetylmuramoyl-L-alanine amidase n=1 Tax=Saccharopolyspora gregorii TaxID=33914 RepID=UPI0021AC8F61|nr:peptidoglycan recognition family protein [Saccharopolyspora gregorii]
MRAGRLPRALAVLTGVTGLLVSAAAPAFAEETPERPDTVQQRAYESAAAEFGVPQQLLMAVSFQLTRWEDHHGEQSKAGGYGPMHLVEVSAEQLREQHPKLVRYADEPSLHTLTEAAELTGTDPEQVKSDVVQNIRAGAALLAHRAEEIDGGAPEEIDDWYPAVAEFSGDAQADGAQSFADDVYDVLGQGRARTTSSGQRLAFPKVAAEPEPDRDLSAARLKAAPAEDADQPKAECPEGLDCRYLPAAYQPTDPEDPTAGYGNYDTANRPEDVKIDSIVIHDTEVSYQSTISAFQNPAHGASSHYVVRSSDGQITQMVPTKDMPWHAGSWDRNIRSIGIEHEGWAAEGGTWYTEPMYRASAKLVRYLADKYDIPLDRAHILGHDEVTAEKPAKAGLEHYDPGPFWDWAHYMNLMDAPLDNDTGGDDVVTIFPRFDTNRPEVVSCPQGEECETLPAQPANFLYLRTEPRADAPLLSNPALHADGEPGTTRIEDWSAKAAVGRQYVVAERRGDWLAIWFDGKKAWLKDPDGTNTAPADDAELGTPARDGIPTYGRALPAPGDYPEGVEAQELEPLPYKIPAGQKYVTGDETKAVDYHATYDELDDPKNHTVIKGSETYVPVSYNHRWVYVKKSDLDAA